MHGAAYGMTPESGTCARPALKIKGCLQPARVHRNYSRDIPALPDGTYQGLRLLRQAQQSLARESSRGSGALVQEGVDRGEVRQRLDTREPFGDARVLGDKIVAREVLQ